MTFLPSRWPQAPGHSAAIGSHSRTVALGVSIAGLIKRIGGAPPATLGGAFRKNEICCVRNLPADSYPFAHLVLVLKENAMARSSWSCWVWGRPAGRRPKARGAGPSIRPRLETLEERLTPATQTFNPTDGGG